MFDSMRALLLAAVGAVDLTDEKLRAIVEDLVRRGEIAADEARDLRARWAQRRASRDEELDERIRAVVDETLGRRNVASHASVADLQARVDALEQAVTALIASDAHPR
jgi:polyhydroxyalkanoate synthesis regulator phasin